MSTGLIMIMKNKYVSDMSVFIIDVESKNILTVSIISTPSKNFRLLKSLDRYSRKVKILLKTGN